MWRLTLTVQSRHVSQRSRFVLSFHRSIREKSASKMPLTKLSRYSRLFRFPVRKHFLWKRCFQKPVAFLYSTRYIYIIRGRDYVEKVLEASNVFTPRKRKSVFEKMFNNRNVIVPNPDFDNTSLIVKRRATSFLTNVYIQILDACRSVERSIARDILLTTRKGKL